jgi:poly-gamma-glutamate capsule biosynthesis protein CapA/YwtB (metallophosphatase superfamily)
MNMRTQIDSTDRRRFLQALTATAACSIVPGVAIAAPGRLRFMALGQAAIQFDLREQPYPGFAPVAALLRHADVCFTDLETPISGPGAEKATRDTIFLKAAEPVVLDCLKALSINVLALSNNHSWDFGTSGVLTTLNAVRARGFTYAGTGENVGQATAPAYRDTPGGRIALVAMASGAIREGAAATATRAGVNEVRLESNGELNSEDTARNVAAIREAARSTPHVFCYQHNHYWEKDFRVTPAWQRVWARQCIDAGACAFISHGAPLLHGIELYRGRPIFYDLGSLIFHTKTAVGYYPPEVWESAVADCAFEEGRLISLELTPVVLNESGIGADRFYETRGRPTIARGADAGRILERLQGLSAMSGVRITRVGDVGRVAIG